MAQLDRQERQVLLEILALMVHRVQQVVVVYWVLLGLRELLDPLVNKVLQEMLEQLDPQDHQDPKGLRVHLDHQELEMIQMLLEQQALRVLQDLLEVLDQVE
jgi:hypothetical protein